MALEIKQWIKIAEIYGDLREAETKFEEQNTYKDLTYVGKIITRITEWSYETNPLDAFNRLTLMPSNRLEALEKKCLSFLSKP